MLQSQMVELLKSIPRRKVEDFLRSHNVNVMLVVAVVGLDLTVYDILQRVSEEGFGNVAQVQTLRATDALIKAAAMDADFGRSSVNNGLRAQDVEPAASCTKGRARDLIASWRNSLNSWLHVNNHRLSRVTLAMAPRVNTELRVGSEFGPAAF